MEEHIAKIIKNLAKQGRFWISNPDTRTLMSGKELTVIQVTDDGIFVEFADNVPARRDHEEMEELREEAAAE